MVQVDGLGRTTATIVNYQDGIVGGSEPVDQDLITRTVYDAAGRRIRMIDPANRATVFAYDQQDRLISVTEHAVSGSCTDPPCNVVTQYRYDRAGNRTAIVDARGHARTFSYDAADQNVEARDALDQATSWDYDAGGRMTAQHDPRGSDYDLTLQYDDFDRPTQTSASVLDWPISQTYDALGRRTSLTDAGGLTSFGYDALGRMTSVDAPFFGTTSYSYDERGRRTQIIYPNTITLDYSYTPDGQLDDVSENSILWEDYSYDSSGRLNQVERRNGTTTTYDYDAIDRLIDLHTTLGTDEVSRFSYGLDRLGRRTVVTETLAFSGMVADMRTSGTGNSNPSAGVTLNGIYYFIADDGMHGAELWQSDGTAEGTLLVKDIQSGSSGSNPQFLTVANGMLFFAATESTTGQELWKSDGTAAGTVLVKDIRPGFLGFLQGITAVGNTLFFAANDGTNGQELWKSDGTSGGTVLVKDIQSGSGSAGSQRLTAIGSTLFFTASDTTSGTELWMSDGTSGGTLLVKDIRAGSTNTNPLNLTAAGGHLLFTADDGIHGQELWSSDGTASGTLLLQDSVSGSGGANPSNLTVSGAAVFFTANDGTHGSELWRRSAPRTTQYGYDGLGRLTGANESPGNSYTYAYDDAGNRTGVWLGSTQVISQSYNPANQVDGWSYDAIGNLIADGSATYGYDALNRVITTTSGLSNRANLYNGDGLLVAQTRDLTITRYLQDLAAPLAQVLDIEQSGDHVQYLYGRERFAEVHGGSGLDETWYLGDALGSVRLALAYDGTYQASANYDPWGRPQGSQLAPFGFTGEVQHSRGMVYLRARWYNAGNGTFTSRDSFPGLAEQPYSQHPYQYGYSDPLLHTDRTGRWVDDPGPSSISRACGYTQGTLLGDDSGCEMPFEADLDFMESLKKQYSARRELDQPCIPYVQFELVFLDGSRLCVMNAVAMQFGVLLDWGLLERIENAPTCLQPVFEVQSNRRIILRNGDEEEGSNAPPADEDESPGPGGPSAPPLGPSGPPRTPRETRLDRLGLDGDAIVDAAEARADVAAKVANYEHHLQQGEVGRTHLERLLKTHLRRQKVFIDQINRMTYELAPAHKILELIEENQSIEAMNILLSR